MKDLRDMRIAPLRFHSDHDEYLWLIDEMSWVAYRQQVEAEAQKGQQRVTQRLTDEGILGPSVDATRAIDEDLRRVLEEGT